MSPFARPAYIGALSLTSVVFTVQPWSFRITDSSAAVLV